MMGAVDEWTPDPPEVVCDVCRKAITDDFFYDLDGPVCKRCVRQWFKDVPMFYRSYFEDALDEYMEDTHDWRNEHG